MRLLFDENLSPRLCVLLDDVFPGSASVLQVGLGGAADHEVWAYAAEHQMVIVSKDLDFVDRAVSDGHGPLVVWVRLGNCSTEALHLVLRNSVDRIAAFQSSTDLVLELP